MNPAKAKAIVRQNEMLFTALCDLVTVISEINDGVSGADALQDVFDNAIEVVSMNVNYRETIQ